MLTSLQINTWAVSSYNESLLSELPSEVGVEGILDEVGNFEVCGCLSNVIFPATKTKVKFKGMLWWRFDISPMKNFSNLFYPKKVIKWFPRENSNLKHLSQWIAFWLLAQRLRVGSRLYRIKKIVAAEIYRQLTAYRAQCKALKLIEPLKYLASGKLVL